MTALPAPEPPSAGGDPYIEVCRPLNLDLHCGCPAEWIDPWPEFIARSTQAEFLVCVIVQCLLKKRDAVIDTLDANGWAWSRGTSKELDAVDHVLDRLGLHPGGGRQ